MHLVSTVRGGCADGAGWPELLAATFPPGSVTGAPKSRALRLIDELEAGPRGPYCGAFGWVDADTGRGELAVAIRTFWVDGGPAVVRDRCGHHLGQRRRRREWDETELKAAAPGAAWARGEREAGP